MKQIRVIKTEQDYEEALARLSDLMDDDIKPGSSKEAELELLALVIESYEQAQIAEANPNPVDAILFRMDQMGLTRKDLVPFLGSLPKVSEVLAGKRPLSLTMIRKIHQGLGIPAEILLAQAVNDVDLQQEPEYDYSRFPWQEMLERGYLPGSVINVRQAKEQAEELGRAFLRGMFPKTQHSALLRAPLHQSGSRLMNEQALLIWRMAVLKKARKQAVKTRYTTGSITAEWLRDLVKLSRFEHGPLLAIEYLSDMGIVMVIEAHFKKTYLDGAAMLDEGTPIVALTLRHDRVDNFWFALLHELIHVQKHLNTENIFIADNLDDRTRVSKEEQEADTGAQQALIPIAEWKKSDVCSTPTPANAIALADRLRIHPAIVAGRVQHEKKNYRLLKNLTEKVRHLFEGKYC